MMRWWRRCLQRWWWHDRDYAHFRDLEAEIADIEEGLIGAAVED